MGSTQWTILITSLLFSAFFSGTEIAFVAANKLHFELKNKRGELIGKILSKFFNKPSRFITTTLVGNTLSLVIYGIIMANILEPVLVSYLPSPLDNRLSVLIIQTVLSTLVVLVTAEFTPKSLFLLNPDKMLTITAIPFTIIYYLLYPFVVVVSVLEKVFTRYFLSVEYKENKPIFGLSDLNEYITKTLIGEDERSIQDTNKVILKSALEFKTVKIRDCLIPRTEIIAVDIDDSIENLKQAFVDSGHSKIIVFKESIDDVVGYVHSLELFKKPKKIQNILTPISIFPETVMANEVLIHLLNERKSLALVVDEYGGTSGIVSVEDIIEEILGEIRDEHDDEELVEQQFDSKNFLFSARHDIAYLNEKYGFEIPIGEYDTLGGYLLYLNENLPAKNQVIKDEWYTYKVVSTVQNRIVQVRMTIND
jgi:CBS domain containing-hemolysin-like protein